MAEIPRGVLSKIIDVCLNTYFHFLSSSCFFTMAKSKRGRKIN